VPAFAAANLNRPGLLRFAGMASQLRATHRELLAPMGLDPFRSIAWHGAAAGSEPDWSGARPRARRAFFELLGCTRPPAAGEGCAWSKRCARGEALASAAAPAGGHPASTQPQHAVPPPPRALMPTLPTPTPALPAGEAGAADVAGACYVAYSVRDARSGACLYLGFNCHDYPITVWLPPPPPGRAWRRLVDTAQIPPEDVALEGGPVLSDVGGTDYTVLRKGAVVFDAVAAPGGRPY
jgi:hypothetical protein